MLLQTTIDITKHHPSVYAVVIIGLIVQTAWSFFYAWSVIGIYVKWTPGSASESRHFCEHQWGLCQLAEAPLVLLAK